MPPLLQLLVGLLFAFVSVGMHGALILSALEPFRSFARRLHPRTSLARQLLLLLSAVAVLIVAGLVEVGIWTGGLIAIGAIDDGWTGFYFALVTYTTLGYGDVIPTDGYRLTAAMCSIAGLLTIGMTTAFIIEVVRTLVDRR